MQMAPAIVVTPPGGEQPNHVEAEKQISYALTASSGGPVQDRACALERLLAASRVGDVVTTQAPIVSPEVELMRKCILADYERDAFSREVRLRLGQEHPRVPGTERLGFAKLDLYPNARPKSVKPIRLVGERAAAEQSMVEDSLPRG